MKHGTYAGYATHCREGTEICDACRIARNEYVQDKRMARDVARDPDGALKAAEERVRQAKTRLRKIRRLVDSRA